MAKDYEISNAIKKTREFLIKKAKKIGIYEDFGQKEIRKLRDRFGSHEWIDMFEEWAMTFDQRQLQKLKYHKLKKVL